MEKLILTGKTPDGHWEVKFFFDKEKNSRRFEFSEVPPEKVEPPKGAEEEETEGLDLL